MSIGSLNSLGLAEGFFGAGKSIALLALMRCDDFKSFEVALLAFLLFRFLFAESFHRNKLALFPIDTGEVQLNGRHNRASLRVDV